MTAEAFVILAAGRGTRIGRVGQSLHKALVPLNGRAVLSHLIDLAPCDAEIIICLGHRSEQLMEYIDLAHPHLNPTYVPVNGWDDVGGGPGWSLWSARHAIGDERPVTVVTCDTLWEPDNSLWTSSTSWAGVAAIPAGTKPERWCRIVEVDGKLHVVDKRPDGPSGSAWVGLARILPEDLDLFWGGVMSAKLVENELQISGGLTDLAEAGRLDTRHVTWTDVGDEQAYARAVAQHAGYDWTKPDEATYILPSTERVVKFYANHATCAERAARGRALARAAPIIVGEGYSMFAYEYIDGRTLYEFIDADAAGSAHQLVNELLHWAEDRLWKPVPMGERDRHEAGRRFYRDKTLDRIEQLHPMLRNQAADIVNRIDWRELAYGVESSTFHGDLQFSNILVKEGTRQFLGIDWRGDFAGWQSWGDRRYDLAKLLTSCVVHWGNARRGDFRRWPEGEMYADQIRHYAYASGKAYGRSVEIIAGLCLLNSAPLHASPLDEILVARGTAWLEDLL